MPKGKTGRKADIGKPIAEFDPKDPIARAMAKVNAFRDDLVEAIKGLREAGETAEAEELSAMKDAVTAVRARLLAKYVESRRKK